MKLTGSGFVPLNTSLALGRTMKIANSGTLPNNSTVS